VNKRRWWAVVVLAWRSRALDIALGEGLVGGTCLAGWAPGGGARECSTDGVLLQELVELQHLVP